MEPIPLMRMVAPPDAGSPEDEMTCTPGVVPASALVTFVVTRASIVSAFTIDAEGNVTLTATLTVNGKEKTGAITGQIKLYAKESLSDAAWTEVAQEQDFGTEGEAQLTPRAMKSSVVPRFFKAKIER